MAGDGLLVPVEASPSGAPGPTYGARRIPGLRRGAGLSGDVGRGTLVRALIPNGLEGTVRDREALSTRSPRGRIPLACPLVRRLAVYREAQVQRLPVQAVGGEEVRREMRALGDFLEGILEQVRAELRKEVA